LSLRKSCSALSSPAESYFSSSRPSALLVGGAQGAGQDAAGGGARDQVEQLEGALARALLELHQDQRGDDAPDSAAVDREDPYALGHRIRN
jgi:hypothetical protein